MRKTWLLGPVAFLGMVVVLLAIWAAMEPATLVRCFDNDGYSPFELATLPFFAAIVPLVWWKCPFAGSRRRRTLLCLGVSIVAIMAIVKELDLHNAAMNLIYPQFVGAEGNLLPGLFKPNGRPLGGTPFKMRVLTNGGVPVGMKLLILSYFGLLFGVFAAGFAYLFPSWLRGLLRLEPAAWSWGACGASGVLVQISDRLPSWLGHAHGLSKNTDIGISAAQSLCTCLEEGGEMMLAMLALLTIYQGYLACGARKMRSEFLQLEIDIKELTTAVGEALGRTYALTPLKVHCTFPVFRGEVPGMPPIFVKIGTCEEWKQSFRLLKVIGEEGLFVKFLVDHPIPFHGYSLFIQEWRSGTMIQPEDMSDAEIQGLVTGCRSLSEVLQNASHIVSCPEAITDPERKYDTIANFVRSHPIAGQWLRSLVAIPVEARTYGGRTLSVLHGDFHAKNFVFENDRLAGVFDFDKLTRGLSCGDLVNALVWRFSSLGLSATARRRLHRSARKIVSLAPWPKAEMRIMANLGRLRFAARRIAKHPNSALIALDIWRRDRKIRELLSCGLED